MTALPPAAVVLEPGSRWRLVTRHFEVGAVCTVIGTIDGWVLYWNLTELKADRRAGPRVERVETFVQRHTPIEPEAA